MAVHRFSVVLVLTLLVVAPVRAQTTEPQPDSIAGVWRADIPGFFEAIDAAWLSEDQHLIIGARVIHAPGWLLCINEKGECWYASGDPKRLPVRRSDDGWTVSRQGSRGWTIEAAGPDVLQISMPVGHESKVAPPVPHQRVFDPFDEVRGTWSGGDGENAMSLVVKADGTARLEIGDRVIEGRLRDQDLNPEPGTEPSRWTLIGSKDPSARATLTSASKEATLEFEGATVAVRRTERPFEPSNVISGSWSLDLSAMAADPAMSRLQTGFVDGWIQEGMQTFGESIDFTPNVAAVFLQSLTPVGGDLYLLMDPQTGEPSAILRIIDADHIWFCSGVNGQYFPYVRKK